ncbi:hypothetical protein D9M71_821990 [compost metagenome]
MATVRDMQVIVGHQPGFAAACRRAMLFSLEHAGTDALDGFPTFATDFQPTVIFNVLLHVALRPQIDQLLPDATFDVQFIKPSALG